MKTLWGLTPKNQMTTSAYVHPATGRVEMTNHTNAAVSRPESLEHAKELMEAEGLTVLTMDDFLRAKTKKGGPR